MRTNSQDRAMWLEDANACSYHYGPGPALVEDAFRDLEDAMDALREVSMAVSRLGVSMPDSVMRKVERCLSESC